MANQCTYTMQICGKPTNIMNFITAIGKHTNVLNMSETVMLEENLAVINIVGNVKWSIALDIDPKWQQLCENHNITCEIFTEERNMGFQQHIILLGSNIYLNEQTDWYKYHLCNLNDDDIKNICKKHKLTKQTLQVIANENNGYIELLGYGKAYNNFNTRFLQITNHTCL